MSILKKLTFWRQPDFDADLSDEMRFHQECRIDELIAEGLSPAEAAAQARREFGSPLRLAEQTRDEWTFRWLEDLLTDFRYAVRALARDRVFTLTALASLALGIGCNTTIFSVTTEILFSQPSVHSPETFVRFTPAGSSHIPMTEYRFLAENDLFPLGVIGSREDSEVNWRQGGESYRLFTTRVTGNYFSVAQVPLAAGRGIAPGERNTAVLTHHFWQTRLAADPAIVGQTLTFDGRPFTIVGLLPASHRTIFGFGLAPAVYLPADERTMLALHTRILDGEAAPVTRARILSAMNALDQAHPRAGSHKWSEHLQVRPIVGLASMKNGPGKAVGLFFVMLLTVVGLLLLIACTNVANLLLARSSARRQEFAIRASLGASRGRLLRQLLTESLVISLVGAAAGLALNLTLTGFLNRFELSAPVPLRLQIEPDWRLLAYTAVLAIISAVLIGLLPAWRATRPSVNEDLKRHTAFSLRNALVVGQLTVSIIVLAAAFLFGRNLVQSLAMNPGFDTRQTIWANFRLVPENYATPEKRAAVTQAALDALRQLPGVDSVSLTDTVLLNDDTTHGGPLRNDLSPDPVVLQRYWTHVGPAYFATMGIPILAGREFSDADQKGVVLNDALARRLFGGASPIGHTLNNQPIIGVVGNTKYFSLAEDQRYAAFEPHPRNTGPIIHFMIRSAVPPDTLLRPIQQALLGLDGSAALEVRPMSRAMTLALLPSRVGAGVLGAMGFLGLLLASIGLYGVLTYSVTRRGREIGVRMALGASPREVVRLVAADGFRLIVAGLTLGLLAAFFVTKPLAMFLVPGLNPSDPLSFLAVATVLGAVGLLACFGPTRRALRVDPMQALRQD
jgi:predicted permease